MTSRRWIIASALVVSAVAAVVVVWSSSTSANPEPTSAPTPIAPRPVRVAGTASSVDPSENSARIAATEVVASSQRWLYLDDAAVERSVRAIATPTAADRLAAEVRGEVAAAREGLASAAGPIWWIVRPLATNVEAHRADYARIAVWVVSVLSAADVAMPQSEWRTVTLELRWVDDAWLVDGIIDVAGPTPMLGPRDRPWAPEELDDALAGFVRIGEDSP